MPRPDLDAIDERILALLVADARRSASEIGRLVTLSPAAAKRQYPSSGLWKIGVWARARA